MRQHKGVIHAEQNVDLTSDSNEKTLVTIGMALAGKTAVD